MKSNRKDVGESLLKYHTEIKNDGLDNKMWFKLWMWVGGRLGWIRRYNILRDYNMIETYNTLSKVYDDMGGDERWSKDLQMMN